MNSGDKAGTIGFFCACVAVVLAIFMVSSCISKNAVLENKYQLACIASHGNWVRIPDSSSGNYGCMLNK